MSCCAHRCIKDCKSDETPSKHEEKKCDRCIKKCYREEDKTQERCYEHNCLVDGKGPCHFATFNCTACIKCSEKCFCSVTPTTTVTPTTRTPTTRTPTTRTPTTVVHTTRTPTTVVPTTRTPTSIVPTTTGHPQPTATPFPASCCANDCHEECNRNKDSKKCERCIAKCYRDNDKEQDKCYRDQCLAKDKGPCYLTAFNCTQCFQCTEQCYCPVVVVTTKPPSSCCPDSCSDECSRDSHKYEKRCDRCLERCFKNQGKDKQCYVEQCDQRKRPCHQDSFDDKKCLACAKTCCSCQSVLDDNIQLLEKQGKGPESVTQAPQQPLLRWIMLSISFVALIEAIVAVCAVLAIGLLLLSFQKALVQHRHVRDARLE